jgi:DNA-binding response OmpR family regulator
MLPLSKPTHFLVVEDDPENLNQVLAWLAPRQVNLLQARNGEQALRILEKRSIDVVITDWQLPGLSGLDLIQALRVSRFQGPLLICTGFMLSAEHLQQALTAGASDYLRKPLNQTEFHARLDKSLQLYSQHQTLEHLNRSQTHLLTLLQDQVGHHLQRLLQMQELETLTLAMEHKPLDERHRTVQTMADHFHKLMQWSRYRFSLRELSPLRFEVRQLFRNSQRAFPEAGERLQIQGGTGVFLDSDIELLQRILWQLLDNALRYTAGEVTVKCSLQDQCVRISVLDQGDLSDGQLERFARAESTGLGLKMAFDLLILLGSQLCCQPRRSNQGSHFYFELPAR